MYYYIFDPPQGAKEYERVAQIKETLSALGIAGEMATPSPGKSVEDIVSNAVSKRFSTIIAVGGIELINRVACAVEPLDLVFGVIPFISHPDITKLTGASDWKSSAEQLRRRRWQEVRLGTIANQTCFITPASITLPANSSFTVTAPSFNMTASSGTIQLTPIPSTKEGGVPTILLQLIPEPGKKTFIQKLLSKNELSNHFSQIGLEKMQIITQEALPIVIAGIELGQSPCTVSASKHNLKLIVGAGRENS